MATSFLNQDAVPQLLYELSKVAKPSSISDYAALGLVAVGSAGYLLRGIAWDKPDPYHHVWFERPQEKIAAGMSGKQETRNIAQKLEEADKDLVIFWGSQSGTAEGFANRLARECHLRFGLETMAADLSDYDAETIALIPETKLTIFIMSTFGEGDPSDNTYGFWDYLTKSTEKIELPHLRYTALGLGNSNYKYYNKVIDVVTKALDNYGAKQLMPVGRANDAEGQTEEDFMAWKDELFTIFRQDLKLEEHEVKYEPTLQAMEDESMDIMDVHSGEPLHNRSNPKATQACSPIKALTVHNPRELFTSSTRNCLHMDLDLTEHPELHYKTGDHLAIWPTNPDKEVARLLSVLGFTDRKDVPILIRSLDATVKVPVPNPTTTSALFRYYLEICGPLSRDTITSLAQFAPSPAAKTYLLELGKSKDAYAEFIQRNHLNIGRLLQLACPDQRWTALPLSYLIEALPHTQPRYYSISSSSVIDPRKPSITALVDCTPLPNAETETVVHGLTTNYLLALKQNMMTPSPQPHPHGLSYDLLGPDNTLAGGKVFAHIRKSKFKLPITAGTPLVMVAAGTGLAPFRAFIAERLRLKQMSKDVGESVLFFGCRHPEEDYIYRGELEDAVKQLEGKLKIITAFSKVQGQSKVYVQDRVRQYAEEVSRLISNGANFYICGRASMAREVGKVVGEGMGKSNGWSEMEVREWSEGVKRRHKWQEDVWG